MEVSEAILELTKLAVYLKQQQKPMDEPAVKVKNEHLLEAITLAIACCCLVEQLEEKNNHGDKKL